MEIPTNNLQEDDQLIMDFTNMFKKDGDNKKIPKFGQNNPVNGINKTPNWLLQIPAKLNITSTDLQQRRYMDLKRWNCIIKTHQDTLVNKNIAAVLSIWNYLFSSKGYGSKQGLTFKQGCQLLEKYQVLQRITLLDPMKQTLELIQKLTQITETKCQINILMKWNQEESKQYNQEKIEKSYNLLKQGLRLPSNTYIYYSYNNQVLCPIGFEITPLKPLDAYKKLQEINKENQQIWLINSTLKRLDQSFHIKRWEDIKKDLTTIWPNYFDIHQRKKGIQRRPQANQLNQMENRGNENYIIEIKRISQ